MTDGLMLQPGAGQRIQGAGMILKVGAGQSGAWSAFEAEVGPGFDVGAHLHHHAEELFYILDGELDLLAFEPRIRTAGDWRSWESASGGRVMRGGPGSTMFVPAGCPHAFGNPAMRPARMLFQAAPPGHEEYLDELAALLRAAGGRPDMAEVAALRRRYDIEQLTALRSGSPEPSSTQP
jgi:oxalate decarboxylase/phosphoglucose isomerase-like protein (cupin superfamily)